MTERVSCEVRDGIAWINLDDGKVNVMSSAMLGEIGHRLFAGRGAGHLNFLHGLRGQVHLDCAAALGCSKSGPLA